MSWRSILWQSLVDFIENLRYYSRWSNVNFFQHPPFGVVRLTKVEIGGCNFNKYCFCQRHFYYLNAENLRIVGFANFCRSGCFC